MANTGSPRDMLLPWTSYNLNNFGKWRLEDRNRHVVAELAFNLDEDDIFGEKHITQFIRDACNESQQLTQSKARIRELEDAFMEIGELIDMMYEQEECVGFKFALRLMKVILKEKSVRLDKEDE